MDQQVDNKKICTFLEEMLRPQLGQSAQEWFFPKLGNLRSSRDLYLLFSAASRFIDKKPLEVPGSLAAQADRLRTGWRIDRWNLPQAARVLAVLSYPYRDVEEFSRLIEQLFGTAEVSELVALYSALPVLPFPGALRLRASEGIRTNMTPVFDAVALDNPYPHDYLEDPAWNQMVLKAMFMERPIFRIWGLEDRCNMELSKMISDYAHERWAAGRSTSPEMWRAVGNRAVEATEKDLQHLLGLEDFHQQAAAVLTARTIGSPNTLALLESYPDLISRVDSQSITWDAIGRKWWAKSQLN